MCYIFILISNKYYFIKNQHYFTLKIIYNHTNNYKIYLEFLLFYENQTT